MTPALRLELRRAQLDVDPPLANAGARWDRRSVCALWLHEQTSDGARVAGCGEASPLPGYSPDTDAEVEHALEGIGGETLARLAAASSVRELLDGVASALPGVLPAARFGLETALLDRLGRRAGQPIWRLLRDVVEGGSLAPPDVALCGLVPSAEPAAAARVAEQMWSAGVRTFKLKIGPERLLPEQEATLGALRARWGMAVALRLDANGSLTRAELGATLARVARFEPELVEEPASAAAPEELADSPCPIALDESLQGLGALEQERRLERTRARAVVLKPTTLGGFEPCLRLAAAARRRGCDAIVSHALEGPLGWAACAHLALALASPRAAGLWPLAHQHAALPVLVAGRLLAPTEPGLGARP